MASQQWEYLFATITSGVPMIQTVVWNESSREVVRPNRQLRVNSQSSIDHWVDLLAQLGAEGWEFVAVDSGFRLFKRPVST